MKYKWLEFQLLWTLKFENFDLITTLRLLNIITDPRYWVISTGIFKHEKNMSTLLNEVVSYRKLDNMKWLTQTQHKIARALIALGTAASSLLTLRSNFRWITIINDCQYYHKKDTSKVYVIWSSPRELISVQIINLDFRPQKTQLELIMTHEKRKRFRHYCRNVLHETFN